MQRVGALMPASHLPRGVAMCGHYADALREVTRGQGTRSSRVAMTPHSSRTAGRTRAILTAMVEPLASPRILRPSARSGAALLAGATPVLQLARDPRLQPSSPIYDTPCRIMN
jgi:hypothetical protein